MKRNTSLLWILLIGIFGGITIIILSCYEKKGWATAVLVVCTVLGLAFRSQTGCKHCGFVPRKDSCEHTHCPNCGKPYEE